MNKRSNIVLFIDKIHFYKNINNYFLPNSVLLLVTPPYFVCFGESSSMIAEKAPNLGNVTCSSKGRLFF